MPTFSCHRASSDGHQGHTPSPATKASHHSSHQGRAPSPATKAGHHHQPPRPGTITSHQGRAPSPATKTGHHHQPPRPGTITSHQGLAPSPATKAECHHRPPSRMSLVGVGLSSFLAICPHLPSQKPAHRPFPCHVSHCQKAEPANAVPKMPK